MANRYNNSRRGYSGGYNSNHQNNQQPVKKSGATYSKISKGNFVGSTIVNAWNKSRSRGLITCTVAPYKGSKTYKADTSGEKYQTMMAEIFYHNTGQKILEPCSMNIKTKRIVLKSLGMVITPNGKGRTSSGKLVSGYFGTFTQS